jgi:hypothetical protein
MPNRQVNDSVTKAAWKENGDLTAALAGLAIVNACATFLATALFDEQRL